ncbi:MAG: putative phosphate transport regulator [Capsulimonas sp.]|jgi:predicted phosphate transport protein (TIGR00153 family)|nr:putative phosphate transport regulator [Capsulimonas sp.]
MRLLPREEKFFDLFDRLAEKVVLAAEVLEDTLQDYSRLEEAASRLRILENEADQIVHEAMDRLNKTFVTPLDREDVLALTHVMDDVLDYTESAVDRMILYSIPNAVPRSLEIATLIVNAAQQIRQGVTGLRNFGDIRGILDPCVVINALENQGDSINRQALRALFSEGHDAVTILKWREVYDHLETALDRCEDVADVLQTIAVKNS